MGWVSCASWAMTPREQTACVGRSRAFGPGTLPRCWVGEASLTGGSKHARRPVVSVASVSDEPSNAASEWMRGTYAVLNDFESPPHEMIRSTFTSDFVYEDRRRGALFPVMDAELVAEALASF